MKNRYIKKFINYVLNGLVISIPVFGTFYIILLVLKWLDGIIPHLWVSREKISQTKIDFPITNSQELLEATQILTQEQEKFTGLGIVILLLLLFLMGWLGSLFINERLKAWFERIIARIPGVNNLYHTISDILGAFVGNKKKFNQPVLVKVSDQLDLEMIGFITDTDLSELGDITGKVAVYFPMSYSFAGHLMIVPVRNIKRVERNAAEVMKYAVSGGIVEIEHDDHKKG
jgi:uncharacterized membrane protein